MQRMIGVPPPVSVTLPNVVIESLDVDLANELPLILRRHAKVEAAQLAGYSEREIVQIVEEELEVDAELDQAA